MRHDEPDPLLNEILGGDEMARLRQATLDRTLDAIRQRKRRRRMLSGVALAVLPGLFAVALFWNRPSRAPNPRDTRVASPAPAPASGDIKRITDDELFALFPDRAMVLIGPPGQQRLVFLADEKKVRGM